MTFWCAKVGSRVSVSLIPSIGNYPIGSFNSSDNPAITEDTKQLPANFRIQPIKFQENLEFQELLHATIRQNIGQSEYFQSLAQYIKSGYLNINDFRVGNIWDKANEPQDILGNILVKEGKLSGRYDAMPTHRIYSLDGFFKLEDSLLKYLIAELEKRG